MNKDTVIALALEAGADMYSSDRVEFWVPRLEKFAALVAAAEREEVLRLHRENQFIKDDLLDCAKLCEGIAAAEREECAKVCDLVAREIDDTNGTATYCAAAIRSRT